MPDITLHDIDEKTWSAIRDAAESEDLSLNQVIKRALRAAVRDDALRASVVREGPSVAYGDPPNLSLSIDPDLLARVRALAVDRGTSVLDLVRGFFASLVDGGAKAPPRRLGDWKGRVRIAPDFDELPPDVAAAFGMDGGAGA